MIFLRKYLLRQNFHPGAVNLFIHHGLRNLGNKLLGMFGPIYLYTVFGALTPVFLLFFLFYSIYSVLLPSTMQLVNKVGFKRSMYIGQIVLIFYFVVYYFIGESSQPFFWLFVLVLLWWAVTFFYWIPYHTDFATITSRKSRAKNFALLSAVVAITSIVTPVLSSVIITYLGYIWLFALVILVIIISTFYLKDTPEIKEKFSYSVKKTYQEFFSAKNRRMVLAYFADGMQSVFGFVVWPLFIFLLLDSNFISVGIITSVIVLAVVILRLVIGDFADRMSKAKIVRYTAIFHAAGWLFKAFVQTPFQIFVVGSYHDFTTSAKEVSFQSLMYEQAADRGHYVDEYTVLRDMALSAGKALSLIAIIILFPIVGLNWLFIIAAVTTPFIALLK